MPVVVESECKSRRIVYEDDGHKYPSAANLGVRVGDLLLREKDGEFAGLCLLVCQSYPRLWMLETVLDMANARETGTCCVSLAAKKLRWTDPTTVDAAIAYYLKHVCKCKTIPAFFEEALARDGKSITAAQKEFMTQSRSYPVNFSFIVQSGPDWMQSLVGQQYRNGVEFHKAIDQLPHRIGKAPTTYAAIYSLTVRSPTTWISKDNMQGKLLAGQLKPMCVLYVRVWDTSVHVTVEYNTNKALLADYKYGFLPALIRPEYIVKKMEGGMLLGLAEFHTAEPLNPKVTTMTTGLAQSLLQKAIRRQAKAAVTMAVENLKHNGVSHRPDLQFSACSGTRQLLWRTVVSCLEDCQPFETIWKLMALALVAHFDPNFRLSASLYQQVKDVALCLCDLNYCWDWPLWCKKRDSATRKARPKLRWQMPVSTLDQVTELVLYHMPCLTADVDLLAALLLAPTEEILSDLSLQPLLPGDEERSQQALTAAYDNHADPNIILLVQAEYPRVPEQCVTTTNIAQVMWDYSSSVNYRKHVHTPSPKTKSVLDTIQRVQMMLEVTPQLQFDPSCLKVVDFFQVPELSMMERREGFLALFGETFHFKNEKEHLLVTLCGTLESPCLVQSAVGHDPFSLLTGKKRKRGQDFYLRQMTDGFMISVPPAPIGRSWTFCGPRTKHCTIMIQHTPTTFKAKVTSDRMPKGLECDLFDATPLLETHLPLHVYDLSSVKLLKELVQEALYLGPFSCHGALCNTLCQLGKQLRTMVTKHVCWNWGEVAEESSVSAEIWRYLLCKLVACDYPTLVNQKALIDVNPVTRKGKAQDKAINYQLEGVMLRMLCLLCMLYPHLLKRRSKLRFEMTMDNPVYFHLLQSLEKLLLTKTEVPSILTPLPSMNFDNGRGFAWPHQQQASERILENVEKGMCGSADASKVGSGKTGTALMTVTALYKRNCDLGERSHGVLFLVPTIPLIASTITEIKKHTLNFPVLSQKSNGQLCVESLPLGLHHAFPDELLDSEYTLVVTTLARARNHPFSKPWTLVVIDECTSVQNSGAIQTIRAWEQVVNSQYGVLLMSATFFRSRYDKLFFMIRMLRSPIPARESHLMALLHSRIICHVPKQRREWMLEHHAVQLSADTMQEYSKIKESRQANMTLYVELVKLLAKKWDPVSSLVEATHKLIREGRRPLVYAKTQKEKDKLIQSLPASTTILTVREGGFGLNLQKSCDALVTRPQPGDLLEQMKGRIDRPGQKQTTLVMVMVYAASTIEEVAVANIRICDGFIRQYLNPLSEEYQLTALGGEVSANYIKSNWVV